MSKCHIVGNHMSWFICSYSIEEGMFFHHPCAVNFCGWTDVVPSSEMGNNIFQGSYRQDCVKFKDFSRTS